MLIPYDHSFFQFCYLYASQNPASPRPEDSMLRARKHDGSPRIGADGAAKPGEDPEVITNYSWRNFFSVINFVHVLQKLTKRRANRILLLVQYKSSVRPATS